MHHGYGEKDMGENDRACPHVIILPINAEKVVHFISAFYTDVSWFYVGIRQIHFEERSEQMEDDCMIQHAE